ncbi:MAG TPA: 3'-5' exonuclease, partial [Candidatus Cloacimonadota bacterium]|nr:3'-5' exonuclease [Candidatus Cloacimonadota bacterium]
DMMTFINSIFSHQGIHSFLASNGMQWQYPMVNSAIGDLDGSIELKCSPYSSTGELDSKRAVFEDFVDKMILPRLNKDNRKEKIAIICRKGTQLNLLQLILEEKGKTGVFQPSASIVDHHLIAPLLAWLKFVAYQDAYSLLAFLRSDYLLLGGAALKRVVEEINATNQETGDPEKAQSELLKPWFDLAARHLLLHPYQILRDLCATIVSDKILGSKRDQLNLQAFMALVKDWELNQSTMGSSISDLLDYIDDNRRQESFNQVSIEGEEHIQLLTIHKSKGLQFDRVFVFYDLSEGHSSDYNQLYWSYRYSRYAPPDSGTYPGFHDIDAYALSFHYADVLKASGAKELWEDKQRQALLEELNNLYVAFTRAKSSLHIYFTYRGQKSWGDYYDSKGEDDLKLPAILANACMDFFSGTESDANGVYRLDRSYPQTRKDDKQDKRQIVELKLQKSALGCETIDDWAAYQPLSEQLDLDWKVVYLDKRQHLFGDVVHYYLSFIHYDREDEHSFARLQCLNRYGSLLPEKVLHTTFDRSQQELQKHSYLFDPEYDKVFTELPVDHYRIDRLMINTKIKEA